MKGFVPQKEYDELKSEYGDLRSAYEDLSHQLAQLKRLVFGNTSERYKDGTAAAQLVLGFEQEMKGEKAVEQIESITYRRGKKQKAIARHPLPDHLERKKWVIEPDQDTSGMKCIGEEVTEILAKQPSRYYVIRIIRRKYARADGQGVVIGKMPTRAIEKGMVDDSVLADMIVSKYVDHLPLYRQAKMLAREGIEVASSTMSDWMAACGRLLEPLYVAMKREVLKSDYLQVDESPIRVQDRKKKGSTHRGFQWIYRDMGLNLVLFDYQKGRSREGPAKMLKNYRGYLQTDGYSVYEEFGKVKGITLLGCMAHARRYFEQAGENDPQRSAFILERMQHLYAIERMLRDQKPIGMNGWQLDSAWPYPYWKKSKTG